MAFNLDLVKPGEEMPRRRVLEDGTYIIGRGKAAKIVLPYPEISERHALLVLRGEKAQLEDLHSANGTYVNGTPIQDLVELNGDVIASTSDLMNGLDAFQEGDTVKVTVWRPDTVQDAEQGAISTEGQYVENIEVSLAMLDNIAQ